MTTASAIAAALADHFINPRDPTSGVVLQEATAPGTQRRIDVLAISLWASRGYGIDAVEIKVTRSDYLREIQDPAKADPWWRNSSRFWIAAPSTAVADPDQLPPGWGLLIPARTGRRFKIVVKAAERKLDMTMPLFAALLGRHVNATHEHTQRRVRAAVDEAKRLHELQLQRLRDQYAAGADPDVRNALDTLRTIQEAAGVEFGTWSWSERCTPSEFGRAIRQVLDHDRDTRRATQAANVADLVTDLRRKADRLTAIAAELQDAPGEVGP